MPLKFCQRLAGKIELFQRLVLMLLIGVIPYFVDFNTPASYIDAKYHSIQILVAFLIASGAAKLILIPRGRNFSFLSLALLGMFGLFYLRAWFDPQRDYALARAMRFSVFFLLPLAFRSAFRTTRQMALAERWLIFAGIPLVIYCLLQSIGIDPFADLYQSELQKSNVHGTMGNAHFLGGYLAVLVFLIWNRIRQAGFLWSRLLYILLLLVVGILLVASRSRGAMLTVGTAAFVALGLRAAVGWRSRVHPVWEYLLVGWLLVVLSVPVVLFWAWDKPESNPVRKMELRFHRDLSINNRIVLSYIALRMWGHHPWWGVGVDRYPLEYFDTLHEVVTDPHSKLIHALSLVMESTQANETHNDFLQYLAEFGLADVHLLVAGDGVVPENGGQVVGGRLVLPLPFQ